MKNGQKSSRQKKIVLVCVLKNKRDLRILLKENWYRVPVEYLPKRKFTHLAFYQPSEFGRFGKRIKYYARVFSSRTVKRIELLPKEKNHPRANDDYLKIEIAWLKKLERPIKNIIPRRVSFGFTSLKSLLKAGDILELYGVSPTEQIVERGLRRLGIKTKKEFYVSKRGNLPAPRSTRLRAKRGQARQAGRYRIDLAVFCHNGRIAIECDNLKAHSDAVQVAKDKQKDKFLKRHGWHVIRLTERDITERLEHCLVLVQKTAAGLGGQ